MRQRVLIRAPAAEVYALFLDGAAFGEILGTSAAIEAQEGGAFTLGEGDVEGRIVKLERNQLIVQAWRRSDWAADEYSIASFRFQDLKDRTQLIFSHSGVPGHCAKDIRQMWYNAWQALKRRFHDEEKTGGRAPQADDGADAPASAGNQAAPEPEPEPVTSDA